MPVPAGMDIVERCVMRKVTWRIVPFLMLCYFVAFVDRVNAGFAALQMNHDIGLSASAFGLGGHPMGLLPLATLSGTGCVLLLAMRRGGGPSATRPAPAVRTG